MLFNMFKLVSFVLHSRLSLKNLYESIECKTFNVITKFAWDLVIVIKLIININIILFLIV